MKEASLKTYPEREKFWAMKLIRAVSKTCAAQDVGPTGALLLTVIATTEDAAGYRRAVTYYDAQLSPLVGVSQKTLSLARQKCVEHGWLCYEPGGKARPGRYWTKIPDVFTGIDDAPSDEGDETPKPMPRQFDVENAAQREDERGAIAAQREDGDVESASDGNRKGAPFLPIPIPIPNKEIPPKPPADEISEAAREFSIQWNQTPGVVQCRAVTPKRSKAFETRIRDPAWDWRVALAKFPLPCSIGNESWKPDIDWFLRPDSVLGVIEGKYDWRKSNGTSQPKDPFERSIDALSKFASSDEGGVFEGDGPPLRLEADRELF